jgi:hypothetical protein
MLINKGFNLICVAVISQTITVSYLYSMCKLVLQCWF